MAAADGLEIDPALGERALDEAALDDPPGGELEPAGLGYGAEDEGLAKQAEPAPVDVKRLQVLVSTARETWVFAKPRWDSRRLGYLRAGAIVSRQAKPASGRRCRLGWYRIEPRGYVCAGSRASFDPAHPVALLAARGPDRFGLPYAYVTSRYPTPTMYARLPTEAEQRRAEPSLKRHLRRYERLRRKADFVAPPQPDPLPELLEQGGTLPGLGGVSRGSAAVLGRARVRSGFALLSSFEHGGRRFGLTTELALLPLDRTRVVAPSSLRGVRLSDELTLPVAFVRSRAARRYRPHPTSGGFAADGRLERRQVVGLTGRSRHRGGHSYLEALDESWLRADQVVRIDRFRKAPGWARKGERKWIDVSILRQALVAYEGRRPVYATLVSTGADGLGDPEETHSTIQGTFLIHTKHLSVTMDGDEQGDEFDLRDVPFVQYFTEGYALHGAYWHDDFGRPRSHGCINLAPTDAAWLFGWTTPEVPEGWHAALSLRHGTLVHIHP